MKHGTRFYVYSSCNDKDDKPFLCEYDEHYPGTIWCIDDDRCKFNYKIDFMRILNYKVEILEEKEIKLLDPNEGYFNDGTRMKIEIAKWNDYDGEQLQIIGKDGKVYLVSSYNTILIKD